MDYLMMSSYRSNPSALLPQFWQVYAGVLSLNNLPTPLAVERIILNENYNNITNDQDIALLKLAAEVNFDGW